MPAFPMDVCQRTDLNWMSHLLSKYPRVVSQISNSADSRRACYDEDAQRISGTSLHLQPIEQYYNCLHKNKSYIITMHT